MRAFQLIYFILITVPVNFGVQRITRDWPAIARRFAFAVLLISLASGMYIVQRQTFAASSHLELPGSRDDNFWQEAFDWVRDNTPKDAVFALSSHYPNDPGNDRQNFRAGAERSALPDWSKDGGVAALFPEIAHKWKMSTELTANVDTISDDQVENLRAAGATWIVTRSHDVIGLYCPYSNRLVKVCELAPESNFAQRKLKSADTLVSQKQR